MRAVPPVQDYARGHGAGSVGHAEGLLVFREVGDGSGWPGRGMAVPQARHCVCQVAVMMSRARASARCLSGSGRIRVRLSRVSQDRAVRT